MVCVHPAHRGQRLSYPLCLAVLHYFRDCGFRQVRLTTNDFRLGALKVYLHLGFRPVYLDEEHPERWARILQRLAYPLAVSPLPDSSPGGGGPSASEVSR